MVAIDFDFEAPGLHYKFGVDQDLDSPNFLGGAVPYLLATADGAASPPPLLGHMISVNTSSNERGGIWLMPSGLAPRKIYWEVLKKLGDKLRLDSSSGEGLMALLDLRARFADEVRPDYLLIDARTGVTDLGGLATTILADTVVCMFVANQESIDGTLAVVKAIKSAPRLADQKPIRMCRSYLEQWGATLGLHRASPIFSMSMRFSCSHTTTWRRPGNSAPSRRFSMPIKSYSKGSLPQVLPPPNQACTKIFRTFRPSPAL